MPLGTREEARKAKELAEKLTRQEYQVVELPKGSGKYYVRKKPTKK